MASHGYGDDFDIVDADGWNQYDSYAMRRAPQQPSIHMIRQMTTKVAPAYDVRTSHNVAVTWDSLHHRAPPEGKTSTKPASKEASQLPEELSDYNDDEPDCSL